MGHIDIYRVGIEDPVFTVAANLYHLHNGLNRGIFEVSGGNCWLFLLPEV
jgi:hypothetical protein